MQPSSFTRCLVSKRGRSNLSSQAVDKHTGNERRAGHEVICVICQPTNIPVEGGDNADSENIYFCEAAAVMVGHIVYDELGGISKLILVRLMS